MTTIEKIKTEIERLKGQLIRGACAAQIVMETNCKDEAYNEVLSFLSTLESEKPMNQEGLEEEDTTKDLEEAAEKKYPVYWKDYPKDGIARSELSYDTNKQCRDAFIAGAKWQAEQDKETIELAEDHAYLAGAVNEREKMLKEAVETELYWDGDFLAIDLNMAALGYTEHDKVKIIIVKEDEK